MNLMILCRYPYRKDGSNCLWEYRWLVGRHVSVSVDDIKNFDENITKKYDKPEKSSISIFSKKKIGLLSFDDFRTEKL